MLHKIINWYFSKNSLPYWAIFIIDCLICYLSGIFVFWLYYHGAVTLGNLSLLTRTILMYMVFNIVGFRIFRTYSGIIRYSSFADLQRVAAAMTCSLAIAEIMHYVIYGWNLKFIRLEGRQIAAMYIIATIGMWGYRILVKNIYDVIFSSSQGKRTLIYGDGSGAVAIAKNIRNEKPVLFNLKGFITDKPLGSPHMLMGKNIHAEKDIAKVIEKEQIKALLISPLKMKAFQSKDSLQNTILEHGVEIYMVPTARQWKPGEPLNTSTLRKVNLEDLLPRDEIKISMSVISKELKDKSILITGSAGSIGSEIVRQVASFEPKELILVDNAETPQHDIELMMRCRFPGIRCNVFVASMCNQGRMEQIFKTLKPEFVFHAAAYKHVPMMEENPSESVQNNIVGTKILADLSVKYGVKKFVMISTDKAVNPSNVMGCSKRICEIYTQSLNKWLVSNGNGNTEFITTRFGNVLGSNGSVIPLFKHQIQNGGPITVTDPEIKRYFMLIPEACKLVLEAGVRGNGGEIFAFDMGKPVKISDLAKRMILLSGAKGINIKYVGLRDGEKMYEEVLSNKENTLPSFNEKIRIAKVREYDYEQVCKDIAELVSISNTYDDMAIVAKMKHIVPEFKSINSKFDSLD